MYVFVRDVRIHTASYYEFLSREPVCESPLFIRMYGMKMIAFSHLGPARLLAGPPKQSQQPNWLGEG